MELVIDGEDGHLVAGERAWSCGGDFADARLNAELRRFLFRDAVVFVLCVAVAITAFLRALIAYQNAAADSTAAEGGSFAFLWDLQFASSSLICIACVVAVVLEVVAGRCFRPNDGRASMLRALLPSLYVGSSVLSQFVRLRITIQDCGDHDVIYGNTTAAAAAAAVDDRQQYCIDRIDPWVISIACAGVPILRLMPQQGVPLLLLLVVGFLTGYALRPTTAEVEYVDDQNTIVVNAAFQIVAIVTCCVFCVRLHATGRERFLAAAAAERARRLAVREMCEVDVLLQRALPEAVLRRVAAVGGALDVIDESSLVSVLRSSVVGAGTWSSAAARDYVTMLHALMSAFDGHLSGIPGVEKVKSVGDAYWAIAGLPVAVPCHASVICRFALMMQVTAANVSANFAPPSGDPLSLRVGVHSGPASASILGTQRLSYEPLGEACDGAEEAERKCSAGAVCVTERVKHRLALEASEFGSAVDSETLTATAEEVDESLVPYGVTRREENGQLYTLFLFPAAAATAAAASKPRIGALEARARAEDAGGGGFEYRPSAGRWGGAIVDQSTVRSRAVTSALAIATTMSAAAMVEMEGQKDALERRMEFVMQRAAENERRARRRDRVRVVGSGAKQEKKSAAGVEDDRDDDDGDDDANRPAAAVDMAAAATLEHAARFDDPEQGPFARASKIPLVYTFADEAAEAGYIEYIRATTTTLRRDVRIGTALLFFVVAMSNAATGGTHIATGVLSLGFLVAAANAALLVLGGNIAPKADTVLPYVAFALVLGGCYVADGNVVGNDPFWVFPVQTTLVDFTVYTLSPLTRSGLNTLFNVASFAKLFATGKGDVVNNAVMAVCGVVALPPLKALVERFTRRAFVERRLAEALATQADTAKAAQTAMLENVVPRHAIAPLRLWLTQNLAPEVAVVQELRDVVVAYVHLRAFTAAEPPPPRSRDTRRIPTSLHASTAAGTTATTVGASPLHWLLEAHKAADGLLDRCVYVTKVKTVGETLILAGPFGDAAEAARAAKAAATPPLPTAMSADIGSAASVDSGEAISSEGLVGGSESQRQQQQQPLAPPAAAAVAAAGGGAPPPSTAAMRTLADIAFVVKSLVRLGVRVEAGVHFGTIVGAVLGTERLSYDIIGEAVAMARRVAAAAAAPSATVPGPLSPGPSVSTATTPLALSTAASADIDPLSPPGEIAMLGPAARTLQPPPVPTTATGTDDDDADAPEEEGISSPPPGLRPVMTAPTEVQLGRNGSSLGLSAAVMLAVAPASLVTAAVSSSLSSSSWPPAGSAPGDLPTMYRLRAKTVSLPTAQLISNAPESSQIGGDAAGHAAAASTTARYSSRSTRPEHQAATSVPMPPTVTNDDAEPAHGALRSRRRRGRTALLQLTFKPKAHTAGERFGEDACATPPPPPPPPPPPAAAAATAPLQQPPSGGGAGSARRPPIQVFMVDVVDETEAGVGGSTASSSLATSLRRR